MKSPIKDKPLRNPGQSLDRAIIDLIFDDVAPYVISSFLLVMLALMEWWRWYLGHPPHPWIYSIMAGGFVFLTIYKVRGALAKLRRLKQGRDGELAVGQYLERLRATGAQVFHDIPGEGFNIDHVVIHASGVYVIETKTYSKPDKGRAVITYDGQGVQVMGRATDNKPVIQAQAAASWIAQLIKESTGRKLPVRAVLVFPGWFIEPTADAKLSDIWVLNPKALPAFIDKTNPVIADDDVRLASYHLSRYIRNS